MILWPQVYPVKSINKVIVKRSVGNGLELTKQFSIIGKNEDHNFISDINFRITSSQTFINQVLSINDDISDMNVYNATYRISSQGQTRQFQIPNPKSNVSVQFNYTGTEQLNIQYYFSIPQLSSQLTKFVAAYNASGFSFISENSCIALATFNENFNGSPLYALFILLGLFLAFLIWLIIFCICIRRRRAQILDKPQRNYAFEYGFLLMGTSQINVENYSHPTEDESFLRVLNEKQHGIIDHEIYQLAITNARKTDNVIKNDFKEINRTIFQIWLNNIVSKYPKVKPKSETVRNVVFNKEEEIVRKYLVIIDETTKKIMAESISVNKTNLEYLTIRQEEERRRVLQLTSSIDKKQVEENMERIFEQQRHDLIIQLKIKEDLGIGKNILEQEQLMKDEINSIYMVGVRDVISGDQNEPGSTLNPSDSNELLINYLDWNGKCHLIKENEKIRQVGRLEYIFQNRTHLIAGKEMEMKNIQEILVRKSEYFSTVVNDLEEDGEIDHVIGTSILGEFEKYQVDLYSEMDQVKSNQINSLSNKSNENRKRKNDELATLRSSQLKDLLDTHKNNCNVEMLFDKIIELEEEYIGKLISEDLNNDFEGTNELVKIHNDIAALTISKLDDKIMKLMNEFESYGISNKRFITIYWKTSKELLKMHESEKEKQMKNSKEQLQKAKDSIGRNVDIEIKELNKQYESKNDTVYELINIQTTLSDSDRNRILEGYNKDNLFLQNNIVNSFLNQRQKVVEAIAIKKAKQLKEMKEKHLEKIEALFERRMKNRSQKSEQEIKNECQTFLMADYMRDQLKAVVSREKIFNEELIANVRHELFAERIDLLNEIEEKSVASILQGQMLKSKELVKLNDEDDKLLKIQLTLIESNRNIPNSQEIFNSYYKTKESLQEEILNSKISQERSFKKDLENRGKRSLLKFNDREIKQPDKQIIKRKEQNFKDQTLKKQIESERLMQNIEKDLLKKIISTANYKREDIKEFFLRIYPIKLNQEIENLVEEIYPKSKSEIQQAPSIYETSLVKTYRKYSESRVFEESKKTPNSEKLLDPSMAENSLTGPKNGQKPDNIKEIKKPEDNIEIKPRIKKRKVRRKTLNEDETLTDGN